jgi:flagellar biosynthesis/type III secretory pathway protein FliH
MTVIKSAQSGPLLKDAIALDLGDLARQAEEIRAAADRAARAILLHAQAEARKLTAGARQEGLAQGRAEGRALGREQGRAEGRAEALKQTAEELVKLQKSWTQAAGQWDAQRQAMEREARRAVLDLALRLGEKITRRVVELDPTVVADQLANIMAQVLRAQDLTVRINPQDRPILEQALPQLLAHFPQFQHVHLVEDAQAGRGSCVAGCGQGSISADLDVQLRRLAGVLLPDRGVIAAPPGVIPIDPGPAATA